MGQGATAASTGGAEPSGGGPVPWTPPSPAPSRGRIIRLNSAPTSTFSTLDTFSQALPDTIGGLEEPAMTRVPDASTL